MTTQQLNDETMKPAGVVEKSGAQTLLRGLSIIEAVAAGNHDLLGIGQFTGISRSTTHRLASALVAERYLRQLPGVGYTLGPKLIELGSQSLANYPLRSAARPFLEQLAHYTQDTVHLGQREQNDVLYIDKISGMRGLEMRSRVGQRMPLILTGIGKALLLDDSAESWQKLYQTQRPDGDFAAFLPRMAHYAGQGYSFDLEENELTIRCVAAPVRNAAGKIIAAISVASVSQYMNDARMQELSHVVRQYANDISFEIGWRSSGR